MFADNCFPSQDRGSGVDDNMIFDRWMPFQVCHAFINTQSAKRYTLVDFHMIPYFAGLAYNNTGTVINTKVFADFGGGMNVDAGLRMSIFRKCTRKKWDILLQ